MTDAQKQANTKIIKRAFALENPTPEMVAYWEVDFLPEMPDATLAWVMGKRHSIKSDAMKTGVENAYMARIRFKQVMNAKAA